jgi:prevent-host-death family protein
VQLGLREANQRFSKAIKAVRAGREVVLTDRGRPIAVITPVAGGAARDRALETMVDEGLITPALRKGPMPVPRWRPVTAKGPSLSRTVIDDRDDRI